MCLQDHKLTELRMEHEMCINAQVKHGADVMCRK